MIPTNRFKAVLLFAVSSMVYEGTEILEPFESLFTFW